MGFQAVLFWKCRQDLLPDRVGGAGPYQAAGKLCWYARTGPLTLCIGPTYSQQSRGVAAFTAFAAASRLRVPGRQLNRPDLRVTLKVCLDQRETRTGSFVRKDSLNRRTDSEVQPSGLDQRRLLSTSLPGTPGSSRLEA